MRWGQPPSQECLTGVCRMKGQFCVVLIFLCASNLGLIYNRQNYLITVAHIWIFSIWKSL